MLNFTKFLFIIAAISAAALASQFHLGNDTDEPDAEPADAPAAQKPRAHARLRANDLPLAHAILKKEDESPEEKILSALDKPTTVEFFDLALDEAINFLSEYHGINIWMDKHTLNDVGVALVQPVTLKLA
jgi:hypothetical protein